jgi:hypothetical protein
MQKKRTPIEVISSFSSFPIVGSYLNNAGIREYILSY